MTHRQKKLLLPLSLMSILVLSACSGGGGGSSANSGSGATDTTVNGTIASGAAWPQGTNMSVSDATGTKVCETTTALNDGSYSCVIPSSAKAPFVFTATHEDKEPMVGVTADLTATTINVNPATHAVAALLVNGDPNDATSGALALIKVTPSIANASAVAAQQSVILQTYTQLAPDAMATAANPFTGKLTVDGTGMDAVLDSVKIVVTPTGAGKASLAISTNVARSDEAQAPEPVILPLTGNASGPAPALSTVLTSAAINANKVTPNNMVRPGTTGQINELLSRITACYSEPQATRVGTKTTTSATAADIISPTCKGLFLDSNPVKYLQNSYQVSGTGAFKGIFTNTSSYGVQYSQANFEFTVKNGNTTDSARAMDGDVVFTARWTAPFDSKDSTGATVRLANSNVDVYTARPDANGKLFLTGNLSSIDASVEPRAEYRDFTHADMKKYSYVNTGYNVYVNAKHNYGKVVVTTPAGNTLTLKQITGGGYGYMGLTKPSEASSQTTSTTTSVVRLAGAYLNAATTSSSAYCSSSSNHPRDVDGSLFWSCTDASTPRNWTDVELSRINDQGVWKFEAYTNWNDANPTATTFRRTLRRAPTLAEITASLPAWPSLTTAMRDQLVTSSASTGGMALSYDAPGKFNVSTTAGGNAWQIPATPKWTPNSVKIYGRDTLNNNAGFDDGVDVFSSWRKAVIGCSSAAGDMHCEGSTGSAAVSNGNFRAFDKTQTKGAAFGTLQFNGSDARRVQNTLTINLRKS